MPIDHWPFCNLDAVRICCQNDAAIAFPDVFPIVEGHTMVVPKKHVASLFNLPDERLPTSAAAVAKHQTSS